jgi:membrane protein
MVKSAFWDFWADDALTQAAAVAFYTALSFAPLLMLATFIFANLDKLAGTGTERQVVGEVRRLIGDEAGQVVEEVRQEQESGQQQRPGFLTLTGIVALIVLIWSASGVFVQLQAALNRIWDVEQRAGQGIRGWLRGRGFSITVVFAVIFILLASLLITAMLNAVFDNANAKEGQGTVAQVFNFVVTLSIYVVLFALIFKFLPDVKVPWRTVWLGAAVTAGLFVLGQFVIGLYLSKAQPASAYGGAGSAVVLLIWVYYSSLIAFFGAELTQAWAKHAHVHIEPGKHAQSAVSFKEEPANEGSVDRTAKAGR